MSALQITIPCIFGVAAITMCFFRRLPACITAYAAFVSAGLLGVFKIPADQYIVWGFIALADTVNIYSTRMVPTRSMHLYTVIGCLAGYLLGATTGSLVAIMGAGALGAILGFLAYILTPEGRAPGMPLSHRLSLLAGSGCTAWFSFMMVAIVAFNLFG